MNILRLKHLDGDNLIYEYQPEGKGEAGEILLHMSSQKSELIKKAFGDSENALYANKAMVKIEDFVTKKNLPMEYTQAWY